MMGSHRRTYSLAFRCAAAASAVAGAAFTLVTNPHHQVCAEAPSTSSSLPSGPSSTPSTSAPASASSPDAGQQADAGSGAGGSTVAAVAAAGTAVAVAAGAAAAQEALAKKSQPSQASSESKRSIIAAMGICGKVVSPIDIKRLKPYEGRWVVTYRSPNSMEGFFDLFQVSNWVRWFARHLSGYNIQIDEAAGVLRVDLLSPIPLLKLREVYYLDGRVSTNQRRDFRAGSQFGRVELHEGCLILHLHWGAPLSGKAEDILRLTSTNTLLLTSDAHLEPTEAGIEGEAASFRCLYHRDEPPQ